MAWSSSDFPVEANEDPVVHGGGEVTRRERNLRRPLAFLAVRRRHGLECDDRLHSRPPDEVARAVFDVVAGEPEVLDGAADGIGRDDVQLVRAEGFIGIGETVDPVVGEIEVAWNEINAIPVALRSPDAIWREARHRHPRPRVGNGQLLQIDAPWRIPLRRPDNATMLAPWLSFASEPTLKNSSQPFPRPGAARTARP